MASPAEIRKRTGFGARLRRAIIFSVKSHVSAGLAPTPFCIDTATCPVPPITPRGGVVSLHPSQNWAANASPAPSLLPRSLLAALEVREVLLARSRLTARLIVSRSRSSQNVVTILCVPLCPPTHEPAASYPLLSMHGTVISPRSAIHAAPTGARL